MNPVEIRAASGLAFIYVLRMLGLFMVMPVLAVAAVKYPDYTPLLLGLAIGGYGLTQALLQIPMGIISDKVGRKPVIVFGLSLFALGSFVAAYADSLQWIVIGRVLQGAGAIAGAIMALAGDVSRDSERSKVMAIIGISIGMSFYLSLFLGPAINESYGLSGVFYLTGLLAVACVPLILFWVPAANNISPAGDTLPNANDIKHLFSDSRLLKLNVSVLLLHMMITVLFSQFPPLLAQFVPLAQHWELYLPVLICSVVFMGLLMALSRKGHQKRVLQCSIGLLGIAFVLLAFISHSYSGLLIAAIIFFIGFNYLEANFPAMVSSISPAGKKGTAMGIFASFQFFGAFLGGFLAGALQQWFDTQSLFILSSSFCFIWITMFRQFDGTQPLKRYTLNVNLTHVSVEQLGAKLYTLDGVKDITIIEHEEIAYLKVDKKTFDLERALQIASEPTQ